VPAVDQVPLLAWLVHVGDRVFMPVDLAPPNRCKRLLKPSIISVIPYLPVGVPHSQHRRPGFVEPAKRPERVGHVNVARCDLWEQARRRIGIPRISEFGDSIVVPAEMVEGVGVPGASRWSPRNPKRFRSGCAVGS
jgi:hypothetical protein